jgi:hypothetical protein
MKRIVSYHVYDTSTDKALGTWTNQKSRVSTSYYEETLYVTPAGEYYLHLVGGPDSPARLGWGGRADFGIAGMGELIEPLTDEEAWAWERKFAPKEKSDGN